MVFTKTIPFSKECFDLIYTQNHIYKGLCIDKYNNKPFNIDFVYDYIYDISMSYDEDMNSLTISSNNEYLMNVEETQNLLMFINDKGLPEFMINKKSGTICAFNFIREYFHKEVVLDELRNKFGIEEETPDSGSGYFSDDDESDDESEYDESDE